MKIRLIQGGDVEVGVLEAEEEGLEFGLEGGGVPGGATGQELVGEVGVVVGGEVDKDSVFDLFYGLEVFFYGSLVDLEGFAGCEGGVGAFKAGPEGVGGVGGLKGRFRGEGLESLIGWWRSINHCYLL